MNAELFPCRTCAFRQAGLRVFALPQEEQVRLCPRRSRRRRRDVCSPMGYPAGCGDGVNHSGRGGGGRGAKPPPWVSAAGRQASRVMKLG